MHDDLWSPCIDPTREDYRMHGRLVGYACVKKIGPLVQNSHILGMYLCTPLIYLLGVNTEPRSGLGVAERLPTRQAAVARGEILVLCYPRHG